MSKVGSVGKSVGGTARSADVRNQARVRTDSARAKTVSKDQKSAPPPLVKDQKKSVRDDSLKTIGQRLAKVRKEAGVTQISLANTMGTTQPSLARFEKDQALPNLRTVMRYAAAIKHDIQARLVEKNSPENAFLVSLEKLPKRLAEIRKERGITQVQVSHRMQTTQPIIARFERGSATPNVTTLERYAEAIGFVLGLSLHDKEK